MPFKLEDGELQLLSKRLMLVAERGMVMLTVGLGMKHPFRFDWISRRKVTLLRLGPVNLQVMPDRAFVATNDMKRIHYLWGKPAERKRGDLFIDKTIGTHLTLLAPTNTGWYAEHAGHGTYHVTDADLDEFFRRAA